MGWLQITFDANEATAPGLETALENAGAVSVTMVDAEDQPLYEPGPGETPLWQHIRVTGLFPDEYEQEAVLLALAAEYLPASLPAHRVERIEDQAWERVWMDDFKPVSFGSRLWICPSWAQPPEPEAVNLVLDPGLAFGTGTHPTTALCLEWLDAQPLEGLTLVDYGCGSGILGIAALLLGASRVYGTDNDSQALLATRENCARNSVPEDSFPVFLPDEFSAFCRQEPAAFPVDGVLANILAGTLISLAPALSTLVKPGGPIVLSGILRDQAQAVTQAFSPWFDLSPPVSREDWVRLDGHRKRPPD